MANYKSTVALRNTRQSICDICIKADVCSIAKEFELAYGMQMAQCDYFKDRNRFVELPFQVGESVFIPIFSTRKILYYTIVGFVVDDEDISFIIDDSANTIYPVSEIGKNIYLTFEEAERALNSSAKSDS